ncbi:TELO2-interacting protein 1 homolog [Ornithodoros turicata]|uniref:TELO2-interacting protein 1 homolog n=1 Tax=Ornithodoros turicata TaxID=34597 RepID=UPI0031386D82
MELFKPICINMIHEQSVSHVSAIRKVVNATPAETIQDLQEYIIVPLCLVFKKGERSEALLIETLECLSDVFKKSEIRSWNVFSDLFLRMLATVSTVTDKLEVASISEEVKLSFISSLNTLMKSASKSIRKQMLSTDFRLCLSHAVTVLLALAQERSRVLQITAMQCLLTMVYNEDRDDPQKEDLDFHVGNAIAGFFPGISIALTRVILGSINRSQEVLSTALNLWTHVIIAVLSDASLECCKKLTGTEIPDAHSKVPQIHRNYEWASSTGEKLLILIRRVQSSLVDTQPLVKVKSVEWAQEILLNCGKSLHLLIPPLLDVILVSSADDDELVATAGRSALTKISPHFSRDSCSLAETLEGEFCKLLVRFPSAVNAGTDSELRALVKLVSGYLMMLRGNINRILMSPLACQRLMNALFHLTEFETAAITILAQGTVCADTITSTEALPQGYYRQFKHFTDPTIFEELKKVCRYLGQYGNTLLLLDLLHQKMQESGVHRKQAILLLNLILLASTNAEKNYEESSSSSKTDIHNHIRSLLDCYLSQEFWEVPLEVSMGHHDCDGTDDNAHLLHISSEQFSIECINSNILQICLLLEGVSVFASVLKQMFRPLLQVTLCPLLERADSHIHLVSHTACMALLRVSASCDYLSIPGMIQDNVDYITNALVFKLRHFKSNPNVSHVVQALVKHASKDAMGLIADVANEVLNALDFCYGKHALILLRVLGSTVFAISSWFPATTKQAATTEEKKVVSFTQFVEEFHRHKVASRSIDDCHEEENINLNLDEPRDVEQAGCAEEEQKPELPCHVKLLIQIMKRCIHLQSSADLWLHTTVYEIIKCGIPLLSDYEDELLPIVHQLWSPLIHRFSEDNLHLSFKAFEALLSLVEASGSFIKQRTFRDVWPRLARYLRKQHGVSNGKGKQYTITVAYKYQLILLQQLGHLFYKLQISEVDVVDVATVVVCYMESSQPEELQKASLNCMIQLSHCSPEGVWYILMRSFYQCSSAWSPAPSLVKVSFLPTLECSNTNARSLLNHIQQLNLKNSKHKAVYCG